ncbi:YqzE family protein [Peribacillus butanolivorans]|uniref:YqzE family protein n=1 Tax=Peribacillus butanolivorans TaxID=421767 RepID=UPI0035D5D780
MSTNAYIKYLTQQLVEYFNLTKKERKEKRRHRKEDNNTSVLSHWFGIVPFALSMFVRKKIKKRKQMS